MGVGGCEGGGERGGGGEGGEGEGDGRPKREEGEVKGGGWGLGSSFAGIVRN